MKQKSLFSFLLVVAFVIFCASLMAFKAGDNAILYIRITDSRNVSDFPPNIREIKVLKNDSFFLVLKPKVFTEQKLENLEPAAYTLQYRSMFGKEQQQTIVISKPGKYTAVIPVNYLDYTKETYKPVIDRLKVGEHLRLCMLNSGCFSKDFDTLTITRNNRGYMCEWGGLKKEFTATDMETFRHFEMELQYAKKGWCTTTITYWLTYNDTTLTKEDGSCEWNGIDYLREQIFAKK